MPYIAPPFTPSVTISGTDLIRNTDEKLQTIANDVGDYLEEETQNAYDDLSLRVTDLETDYNTVLKPEIEAKMDDLLSVNPNGTYYTKNAIDTLVGSKVSKITSVDNQVVRFNGTTGEIKGSGVVINDNVNMGLGVTPSAWSNSRAIELQNGCAIRSFDLYSNIASIQNAYYDGVWKYKTSNFATMISQNNGNEGDILFRTAQSSTVDNQITWVTALIIPNTGGIQLPNTAIANATTLDWHERATATLTATGMTTAPTGTVRFTRNGDTVTALIPAISGISNATTFTLTGIPTNFRPSFYRYVLVRTQDNSGALVVSNATVDSSGVLTMYKDVGTTAFTASGIKSVQTIQIQYHI